MRGYLAAGVFIVAGFSIVQEVRPPTDPLESDRFAIPGGVFANPPETPSLVPPVPPDVYDDATAVWTFNQPGGLGFERNDSFEGNATDFEASSTQSATVASDTTLQSGTGDFGLCAWYVPEDVTAVGIAGKWTGANREYGLTQNGSGQPQWCVRNSANGAQYCAVGATNEPNVGERALVCGYHDDSADTIHVTYNDDTPYSAAMADTPREATQAFEVAGIVGGGAGDGVIGPVYWYKGSIPPVAALYNSGKGVQCADASPTPTSCWDMDEASGDYIDSIGSNDLTPVNSPTQTTGLIVTGDGDPDLYLTEVNSPTARGGALGYATELLDTSSQYATVAAITAKGTDRSVCAWWDQPSLLGDAFLGVGNVPIEFTPVWYLSVHVSNKIQLYQAGNATVGTVTISSDRNFICYTYDHSPSGAQVVYVNGVSDITKSFLDNAGHNANNFYVGVGFAGYWKGQIGPVVYYDAPIAQAEVTSMYNSGKGKTCADLSGDELTDLVSCWEMEEDGGPYIDSIGSSDLTGVTTPTRAAGLVERSDSGMAVKLPATNTDHLEVTGTSVFNPETWSMALWVNPQTVVSNTGWVTNDVASPRGWALISNGSNATFWYVHGLTEQMSPPASGWYVAGEWHMVYVEIDVSGSNTHGFISVDAAAGTTKVWGNSTVAGDSQNFSIGEWFAGGVGNVNIDNVAFWPRKLTSQEITDLWNAGAGDFYSAYWDVIFEQPHFAWSLMPERRRIYAVH